jgi:hypothetical protein
MYSSCAQMFSHDVFLLSHDGPKCILENSYPTWLLSLWKSSLSSDGGAADLLRLSLRELQESNWFRLHDKYIFSRKGTCCSWFPRVNDQAIPSVQYYFPKLCITTVLTTLPPSSERPGLRREGSTKLLPRHKYSQWRCAQTIFLFQVRIERTPVVGAKG